MMIQLNTKEFPALEFPLEELFTFMWIYYRSAVPNTQHVQTLINKGYAERDAFNNVTLTTIGKQIFDSRFIVKDNLESKETLDEIDDLSIKLKSIFPKGTKEGTNTPWTEGTKLIKRRLLMFFKKYGKYSNEDILAAAESYVHSFNGNYSYMRVLKYFIFKEAVKAGEVESSSELLTYIENAGQENNIIRDWTSDLR